METGGFHPPSTGLVRSTRRTVDHEPHNNPRLASRSVGVGISIGGRDARGRRLHDVGGCRQLVEHDITDRCQGKVRGKRIVIRSHAVGVSKPDIEEVRTRAVEGSDDVNTAADNRGVGRKLTNNERRASARRVVSDLLRQVVDLIRGVVRGLIASRSGSNLSIPFLCYYAASAA
jgi:hypothetical protein